MNVRWSAKRIAVGVAAVILSIVAAESATASPDTTSRIESLLSQLNELGTALQENPRDDVARKEIHEVSNQLIASGDDGREAILSEITTSTNEPIKRELTYILGEIPGVASDKMLIGLLCSEPSPAVGSMALMQLLHRADSNGPLSFALSEEELEVLLAALEVSESGQETLLIRLLGICAQNDDERRFTPIIKHFRRAVRFEGAFPRVKDSFLSPRVYALNGYLLAFKNMGAVAWEPLRHARKRALEEQDHEFAKWLCIAAGFAADPDAAECTQSIVLQETDTSTKYEAICAYAWSARMDAIPLLEKLVDDKTESEYSTDPWPFYIIGSIARGHLRELTGAANK